MAYIRSHKLRVLASVAEGPGAPPGVRERKLMPVTKPRESRLLAGAIFDAVSEGGDVVTREQFAACVHVVPRACALPPRARVRRPRDCDLICLISLHLNSAAHAQRRVG